MIEKGIQKTRVANYLVQQYEDLKSQRADKEDVWLDCIYAYMSHHTDDWTAKAQSEGRSHRYMGLTFDAVETLHSQLSAMLFPGDEWLSVQPGRVGMDMMDDETAADIELFLKWQHRQMGFTPEYKRLVKQLIITGNCPWSMNWRIDYAVDYPKYLNDVKAWMDDQKLIFGEYKKAMEEYEQVAAQAKKLGAPQPMPPRVEMPKRPPVSIDKVFAGPEFMVGDIFDYVQDPHASDPGSALRAQRIWRSKAHLKKLNKPDETGYKIYDNLDAIHDGQRRGAKGSDNKEEARASAFGLQLPDKSQVELLEFWGTFEIPGGAGGGDTHEENKIYENYVAVVANRKHLIRFEPSHLWSGDLPRQLSTLIEVPGQIYGTGLIEPALGVQDLANVRANQMVDAVAFAINPEMKAVDDGVIDPNEESGPGVVHLVGNLNNLQPVQKDLSGLQLAMSDLGQIKSEFQQITRASSQFSNQHYARSATEVSQSAGVTGSNLNEIAMHIEETSLRKVIELQLQFTQQYMDNEEIVKVTQGGVIDWKKINPEDVRRKWDLIISGSKHMAEQDKRIQQMLMFLQITTSNPMLVQSINVPYLLKKIYEEHGFRDADKMLISPGENQQQGLDSGDGTEQTGNEGGAPPDQQ